MDEDCTEAAWHQLELEQRRREDELIKRHRKEYGSFRAECDAFTAEFNSSMRSITKGNEHGDSSDGHRR